MSMIDSIAAETNQKFDLLLQVTKQKIQLVEPPNRPDWYNVYADPYYLIGARHIPESAGFPYGFWV